MMKVQLAVPYDGHDADAKVNLPDDEARQLISDGWARVPDPSDEDDDSPAPTIPPLTGRGSGRETWAAYAAAHHVPTAEEQSRDDIVAALRDAGIPVE